MSYFKNSKNAMSIIGNLGADAESKDAAGTKVHSFSVATTRVSGKEKEEKTIWIRCELWGENAVVPFLKKGKQVAVEAYYDNSTSEKDGEKKYHHIFKVDSIILL